jgi:hypothetical protein
LLPLDEHGNPSTNHQHAHIFCEANGPRDAVTHLTVWAPMGFDEAACLALWRLNRSGYFAWTGSGRTSRWGSDHVVLLRPALAIRLRLSTEEWTFLRSQIVTSSSHGGRRHPPLVFTEHGAIMAATVLNSPCAVAMSVYVFRAFVRLRNESHRRKKMPCLERSRRRGRQTWAHQGRRLCASKKLGNCQTDPAAVNVIP